MTATDQQVARTFELWRSMLPDRPDVGVEEFRAGYDRVFETFPVDEDARIVSVDANGVAALQVSVSDDPGSRYVVYFHGGGLMCGSAHGVRGTAAAIARSVDGTVLVPEYRLAPEHAFPAANQDALNATNWLLDHAGVETERLVLVGDSAGAGLAISVAIQLRESGRGQVGAVVAWSPWVDLTVSGDSMVANAEADPIVSRQALQMSAAAYLQGHDPLDPQASPLHADLAGLAPLLVQVGTAEVLLDDARRLAQRAEAAGVDAVLEVAEGLPHVYQYFAWMLPEGQAAIDRAGAFAKQRIP